MKALTLEGRDVTVDVLRDAVADLTAQLTAFVESNQRRLPRSTNAWFTYSFKDQGEPLVQVYVRVQQFFVSETEIYPVLNIANIGVAESLINRGLFTALQEQLFLMCQQHGLALAVENVLPEFQSWFRRHSEWRVKPGSDKRVPTYYRTT